MTKASDNVRVLLDESVPAKVAKVFQKHGHEVIPFLDAVKAGSEDVVVARAALMNNAVLVAFDKDMKQIAKRKGINRERFKKLSLVQFQCAETQAAARLEAGMSFIEHEWAISTQKQSRRLFVVIGKDMFRTHR